MLETLDKQKRTQVLSDTFTVWVNGSSGDNLGRFSKWGIDIHNPLEAQMEGANQCLHCTHQKPTYKDWVEFKKEIKDYFEVVVSEEHCPLWVKL